MRIRAFNGLLDSGVSVTLPAGASSVESGTQPLATKIIDIPLCPEGPMLFSGACEPDSAVASPGPVWLFEHVHSSPQGARVVRNKEFKAFQGISITDVSVMTPCRVYLVPSDGDASRTWNVRWVLDVAPASYSPQRESQVRRTGAIPPNTRIPGVSGLLMPLGGSYGINLYDPTPNLMGWRPNYLSVRKVALGDAITVFFAVGTGGGTPDMFSYVSGVNDPGISIPVDPSWASGVQILNNSAVNPTSRIILLWERRTNN